MPPSKKQSSKILDKFLLIVESPSKCAKIESYLGDRYQCISSKGHIREIDSLSSINTKDNFQIEYTPIKEKREHIETMRKTVAKYSPLNILLATDDDREGEAIAWHICQVCGLDVLATKRIVFHEITQPALVSAVANPGRINLSLVAAQQARQVLDMVVGYKISPLLWRQLGSNRKNALSAGRCQTPALRLVYDHHCKYIESRESDVSILHKVSAIFTNRGIKFDLDIDISSQELLLEFLEKSKTYEHRLSVGKTRPSVRAPPKPFNTSRLLQVASNNYRLSPKRTMELCQTLYQSGLITYMRTDCQKYSDVFLKKSAEYIAEKYGNVYVGDLGAITLVDTTMPHEGIRVTNLSLSSMTSNDQMMSRIYGLIWRNTVESCMATARYNITDYTVSSPFSGETSSAHSPSKPPSSKNHSIPTLILRSDPVHSSLRPCPFSVETSSVKESFNPSAHSSLRPCPKYKYTMETPVFLGWRRVEIKDSLTDTQAVESSLALYFEQIAKLDTPLTWSLIETKSAVDSRLPGHYTEASLIQKLEDLGIGRPSTFASIVETIQDRGYAKLSDVRGISKKCTDFKLRKIVDSTSLEKLESDKSFGDETNKLVIQPVGILVIEYLLQHFDDCFSYDYTKSMEEELDVISSRTFEEAQATWHEICRRCFNDITKKTLPLAKQTKQTFALSDTADHVLVFNTYGASIKNSSGGYMKIRTDVELDLDKAKRGEYAMAELVWREDNGCLGEYHGTAVYLKNGKFGLYAEWDGQTISLKPLNKPAGKIELEDVIRIIESKSQTISQEDASAMFLPQTVFGEDNEVVNTRPETMTSKKTLLRELRPDLSIRKGKYGPYIFHQNSKMSKPEFHPIKPFKDKWEAMSNLELIAVIENTYRISI